MTADMQHLQISENFAEGKDFIGILMSCGTLLYSFGYNTLEHG